MSLGLVSLNSQSLEFQASGKKHTIYFSSAAADGLLYKSQSLSWGWLGRKEYRVSADTSTLAALVCLIRDFFERIAALLFGPEIGTVRKVVNAVLLTSMTLTLGPMEMVCQLAAIYLGSRLLSLPWPKFAESYPINRSMLKDVAIGVLSWVPSIVACANIERGMTRLLDRMGVQLTQEQEAVELMQAPGIGTIVSFYGAIGAPILEEWLFRGVLRDELVRQEKDARTIKMRIQELFQGKPARPTLLHWQRWKTILKTSLLFGLCHGTIRQGWTNLPVIAVTTFIGFLFAILRELTGNLWASTTLHAVHNSLIILRLHDLIPPIPYLE